ncbi:MAG: S-ribosylhomocysteine lyase [Ruminococcaceae bacterium]|nr:S-ribosylhomocysteine lyase [Oscillospiraceae bacterium]
MNEEKKVQRIKSFEVNHDLLTPGIYISRVDGDVTTFDMRTRTPNASDYMDNLTMHSFEHMFATYVRSSALSSDIIYFGPMGCQTGFYLLVRNAEPYAVLTVVRDVLQRIIHHTGEMFGASRAECGNYKNLDVSAAVAEAKKYLDVLDKNGRTDFRYAE